MCNRMKQECSSQADATKLKKYQLNRWHLFIYLFICARTEQNIQLQMLWSETDDMIRQEILYVYYQVLYETYLKLNTIFGS